MAGHPVESVIEHTPATTVDWSFGPIDLVGFDPPPSERSVGDTAIVRLFWRPTGPVPDGSIVRYTFVDSSGEVAGAAEAPLVPASFPASGWLPGRTVAVFTEFILPARADTGDHRVLLDVIDGSGRRLAAKPFEVATVKITAPQRTFQPPLPSHNADVQFDSVARLVGYDLELPNVRQLRLGETLRCTLYWQATGETDVNYKVFLHLVGPDGKIYGQKDAPPGGEVRPLASWLDGEYLSETLEVPLSASAPAGRYVLRIGLYHENSGRRLPLIGDVGDAHDLVEFEIAD